MAKNNILLNKKFNGIYYTPPELAETLVHPLIEKYKLCIFDPAYGDGSLLLTAEKLGKALGVDYELFGCDKSPVNGFLKHMNKENLLKKDFFSYSADKKFDLVLMNPPYVRHHRLNNSKKIRYQKKIDLLCKVRQTSDLWVYFLVKATNHLKEGGNIGAILPWSFLQAEYSQSIRTWLAERFESIKVLSLGAEYFEKAKERVILLWLRGYGVKTNSIEIAFSQDIEENSEYFKISMKEWGSSSVCSIKENNVEEIIEEYIAKYNFVKFSQYCDVKIGIVTGADDFFIISKDIADVFGIKQDDLLPIITTAKEFHGLHFNGYKPHSQLFYIAHNHLSRSYLEYIKAGEELGYNLRAHSQNRDPWYAVSARKPPDAFFPYRATAIPYFSFNDSKVYCTNSIHRLYFNNLSEHEKKWLQVSMLSAPAQLSLEAFSKVYGKGVLKIEPKALKNSIVYLDRKQFPESLYADISRLISSGNKVEASEVATKVINKELGISRDLETRTIKALKELQRRRMIR
ncbi:MAG: N-6 DNA methylase [Candidatus Omnitrophota bacterium]